MDDNQKIQLLRNAIRSAMNPYTGDTDNIHACSATFSSALGRDTVSEAREAKLAALSEKERAVFHDKFPFGFNLNKLTGPKSELTLDKLYSGKSVAMALSAIALKEGMQTNVLLTDYPDVTKHFQDAASINEMRERFPELKTKHINRVIRTLAFEELRAALPDVKEKKLMKAARKLEIQ